VNALSAGRLDLADADAVTVRREIAAGQLEDARQIAAEAAARNAELDVVVDIDDDRPAWRAS
jgi:hypothetical protein